MADLTIHLKDRTVRRLVSQAADRSALFRPDLFGNEPGLLLSVEPGGERPRAVMMPNTADAPDREVKVFARGDCRSPRTWFLPLDPFMQALEWDDPDLRIEISGEDVRLVSRRHTSSVAGNIVHEATNIFGIRGRNTLGWRSFRRAAGAGWQGLKTLFGAVTASRLPPPEVVSFSEVPENHLRALQARYFLQACLAALGASALVAYGVTLALHDAGLPGVTAIAIATPLLALAMRASFRNWQIRNRRFGGFRQWLRSPGEWLPR